MALSPQARALLQLTRQQRDELKVRAGLDGMLQLVPVEVGQQVAPGQVLVRFAPAQAEGSVPAKLPAAVEATA